MLVKTLLSDTGNLLLRNNKLKMRYIVAYDIESDKRRNKLAKLLEDFGVRLQKSVFECKLTQKELTKLMEQIKEIINLKKDSVIFFPNCNKCYGQRKFLGITYTESIVNIMEL